MGLPGLSLASSQPRSRVAQLTLLSIAALVFVAIWDDYELSDLSWADADVARLRSADGGTCSAGGETASVGVPGFQVFTNAWYRSGTLHLYGDDLPEPDEVSSMRRLRVERHRPDRANASATVCFPGTTVFVNAQPGRKDFVRHYYHFAGEYVLGALAALAAADVAGSSAGAIEPASAGVPERLVVPWAKTWRDKWGLNAAVASGLFGADIIEPRTWRQLTRSGEWAYFERIVVVDRWASHRHNPAADVWNKMALPAFELGPPLDFFENARLRVLRSLGIAPATITSDGPIELSEVIGDANDDALQRATESAKPTIVYVDRQGSRRRLRQADHEALLLGLSQLQLEGRADVRDVPFETMSITEQIEVAASASIMLGVHGNGLTHQLWMPAGSALVEIFPPQAFVRDYQAVAQVLRHPYVCIQNDTVLDREQWEERMGGWGDKWLHTSTPIPVSADTVLEAVERLLADM
ncbi:hypothetical protein Q5752_004258 [Cryptotrichosporon argae]